MGKASRNEYLAKKGISFIDFLPERVYSINGIKAIPRKNTRDFAMLFIPSESALQQHFTLLEGETFVDVGANVGSYSLRVASEYKDKQVRVIAIEAHPKNCAALRRNIACNNFDNIRVIEKAACDEKRLVTIYERHDEKVAPRESDRTLSDLYTINSSFAGNTSELYQVR